MKRGCWEWKGRSLIGDSWVRFASAFCFFRLQFWFNWWEVSISCSFLLANQSFPWSCLSRALWQLQSNINCFFSWIYATQDWVKYGSCGFGNKLKICLSRHRIHLSWLSPKTRLSKRLLHTSWSVLEYHHDYSHDLCWYFWNIVRIMKVSTCSWAGS